MTDGHGRAELYGTYQEQLIYLTTHWGARYRFAFPEAPGGQWTARAKFGARDEIQEFSAAELLEEVRAHYQAHSSRGDESLRGQPGVPS